MPKNTPFLSESFAMRALKRLGMESMAWSLRRLHCPVQPSALVLEVGAGGNPYPRANVLLDAYESTVERIESELVKDRPIVLGYAECMPFKSKAFDFIIASHVLEHSFDPENFLKELMRVGKAGYIETPDGFFERINPFTYHRLEVTDIGGKLRIFKKSSWRHDGGIVGEYERKMKDATFLRFLSKHPEPFYTRFYWQTQIPYWIVNPDVDVTWPLPEEAFRKNNSDSKRGQRSLLRWMILLGLRRVLSQTRRNRSINVYEKLRCPSCTSETGLVRYQNELRCNICSARYPIRDGIPVMYPSTVQR